MPRHCAPASALPLAFALLFAGGVARAQDNHGASAQGVQPAPAPAGGALRDYTLRNQAHQAIVEAHAGITSKGEELISARGAIMPDHAQTFHARRNECLGSVSVKFKDGTSLHQDNLHACHETHIVVSDDRISVQ